MEAETAFDVLSSTDQLPSVKIEDLVGDGGESSIGFSVGLLPEAKRQVSRGFEFSLDKDFGVVFELDGETGGFELGGEVTDGEV